MKSIINKNPYINKTGRPLITEYSYKKWLDAMSLYLLHGHSINYAIDKAGLEKHKTTIYEKYAQRDWFSEKIDQLQATIGELTQSTIYKVISNLHAKMTQNPKYIPNTQEVRILVLVATKHRSSQPFFVTRKEISRKAKEIGRIIEQPKIVYSLPN